MSDSRRRTSPNTSPAELLIDGRRIKVSGDFLMGRASEAGLVLDSTEVSRHHARIDRDSDGGFVVVDLNSKNGTYVNGARVNESAPLADGDELYIGGSTLRFLCPERKTRIDTREGPPSQRRRLPRGEALTIGRDSDNDIVLDDPNISRFHAEITDFGGNTLRDLGSRNGTYLNGEAIQVAEIQPGDRIRIGSFQLELADRHVVTQGRRVSPPLRAEDVSVVVEGKQILAPTSLGIAPGEFVAIIGESGSGKTTLLRALAGVGEPTSGRVLLGDEDVRSQLTDTGYVPQHEIVHELLSVEEALMCSAQLRLPTDTDREEMRRLVDQILDELSLRDHRSTRIDRLSGGQRRRVGVGVELLGQPSLLFLDEPTTGLDPLLESRAMTLFRELSDRSRGVVMVTHATQTLDLCDRLIVMAQGGLLVYDGRPSDAREFFGVESLNDVYAAVAGRPAEQWRQRFEATRTHREAPLIDPGEATAPPTPTTHRPRTGGMRQAGILLRRYTLTFTRDRRNMAILFGQVPLIAMALVGLFDRSVFAWAERTPKEAMQLLFLLVTLAVWFGLLDATRELVKERRIFERERGIGVGIGAYLSSKVALLFSVSSLQVLSLAGLVLALRPLHASADVYLGVLASLLLAAFSAVTLGLCVSALVNSEDQATSLVPLLLVPQLFFAGAIIPVARMGDGLAAFTNAIFAKWSFALCGTLTDMQGRIAAVPETLKTSGFGTSFFSTPYGLAFGVLVVFCVCLLGAAALALRVRS